MKNPVLAIALALLSTNLGCEKLTEKIANKAAEKAVEGAAGGDVKVDTSGSNVSVTDRKTGTVAHSGASVPLPAGWPASVPLYPGAIVRNAVVAAGGKSATLATKDPAAKVHDFYAKTTTMKLENDIDLGGQRMMAFKNGKGTTSVTIGAAGAETMINIAIAD